MGEAERVEKIKKQLEIYVFGGNQEIVLFVCNIMGISNYKNIEIIQKKYKNTDNLLIKGLNYFNEEYVESFVKNIAREKFSYYDNIDVLFKSHNLPFGNENKPSHWDNDKSLMAKKMIQYSELESDEKETLLNLVDEFKIEMNFSEIMFSFYNDVDDVKFKLYNFIKEIKRQELDIQFRLKLLSDLLRKINLSIIKNNEVINSRAFKYKKDISKKINETIFSIKSQIEKELEFYIKTINSTGFLGFIEETEPREFLIGKLIENKLCFDKFNKLEKKLISINLLSNEYNRWLGTAIGFIEFYQFCEHAKLFKSIYMNNSKGVKILRNMYRFYEGQSIDKPSKRIKYISNSKITYHTFLQCV